MSIKDRKKILLARTDRLGDLVLTTPAIKAVREAYPDAYIAMIVRPYTAGLLKENPYLDDVIVYDKYGAHRSVLSTIKFGLRLRKTGFDRAIIFHPTNRMHIVAYMADIPRRVGYGNKTGFLLTDRIKNLKRQGKKHERDYTLDMLRALGIESREKELYACLDKESVNKVDNLLRAHGISPKDKLVVIHPGASCVSKIWPAERFAKLSDILIENHNANIAVIGGDDKKDTFCAENVKRFMKNRALFLTGSLSIEDTTALLKRAAVFVSNDSGPVHIATAVNTPVVDIFGRSQPGLSPVRWGALGKKDIIIHKDAGCKDACTAHNCKKSFACLRAISVDDVYSAVLSLNLL